MLNTPEIVLEDFRVSTINGFLPDIPPLERLSDPYYEPWESIAHVLPVHIREGSIRQAIDCLPILSTSKLNGEAEWRRAYVVLAYLSHAYIWGDEKPSEVSPANPSSCMSFLTTSRDYHQQSHVRFSKCRLA